MNPKILTLLVLVLIVSVVLPGFLPATELTAQDQPPPDPNSEEEGENGQTGDQNAITQPNDPGIPQLTPGP